ncbi:MAG: exbB 4 [Firmicutes bacterium]|nr:exbB 4 [Bacillota bacterium]
MDLSTTLQLFSKGGLVMYPLLACSILSFAIGLERFLFHRVHHTDTTAFLFLIKPALDQHDWNKIQEICQSVSGDIARILEHSLAEHPNNPQTLQQILETKSSLAAARLRERLSTLENIVTVAPLLGLLGTVVGMIHTFGAITLQSGQPHAITGGVGEALVATGTGLSVAIFAFVIHSYFVNRLDKEITNMEEVFGNILIHFTRNKHL